MLAEFVQLQGDMLPVQFTPGSWHVCVKPSGVDIWNCVNMGHAPAHKTAIAMDWSTKQNRKQNYEPGSKQFNKLLDQAMQLTIRIHK